MKLSAEQLAAVERTGQDVCVVAGPGSGKTRVLVERYAWLAEKQGLSPLRILAITFTDKAASEIKERLIGRLGAGADRRREIERAPVSTVHGLCVRLLRENAIAAGLDPAFRVLDETEARLEQSRAIEAALDDLAARRGGEFQALAEAWNVADIARDVRAIIAAVRSRGVELQAGAGPDPEELAAEVYALARSILAAGPKRATDPQRKRAQQLDDWLAAHRASDSEVWLADMPEIKLSGIRAGDPFKVWERIRDEVPRAQGAFLRRKNEPQLRFLLDAFAACRETYSRRKREISALDFNDLEERTLALLDSNPALRDDVREQFEAILMDELQDTNPLQWRIVNLLRTPGRFFAVGDVNQSIYGFRFAEPREFERYQGAIAAAGQQVDRLQDNYRSRPEILAFTSAAVAGCAGIRAHELRAQGRFEPLPGPSIELLEIAAEEDGAEALWVARRIRELEGTLLVGPPGERRPARFSDMAILVRSTTHVDEFETALARFHVPALLRRGKNFFDEPEVLDLANWLRVLENPLDPIPLLGLLRSPFFGVSDEEIYRARLAGGLAPPEAAGRIARARELRHERPIDALLARLVDECGYLAGAPPRVAANVAKFLTLLRGWQALWPGDLRAWLAALDDLRAAGSENNALALDAGGAVEVMTIHKAKGLEFPIVFLAAAQQKGHAAAAALNWSAEHGLGLSWRDPRRVLESRKDPVFSANAEAARQREDEEADRLLYVALTRAAERLVVSWDATARGGSGWPQRLMAACPPGAGVRRLTTLPDDDLPVPAIAAAAEPELLDVSPAPHSADATISVSDAAEYAVCPRRYFLSRYTRWPELDATPAATLGSQVHDLLAGKDVPDATPEARRLAAVFPASELGRRAAAARRAEREFALTAELAGAVLSGTIDLYFEDPAGRIVLTDYKTDRELTPARLLAYSTQLQLYAAMLAQALGRPVTEAALFLLRENRVVPVPVDAAALTGAQQTVRDCLAAQARLDFPPRESDQCQGCRWRESACPLFTGAERA